MVLRHFVLLTYGVHQWRVSRFTTTTPAKKLFLMNSRIAAVRPPVSPSALVARSCHAGALSNFAIGWPSFKSDFFIAGVMSMCQTFARPSLSCPYHAQSIFLHCRPTAELFRWQTDSSCPHLKHSRPRTALRHILRPTRNSLSRIVFISDFRPARQHQGSYPSRLGALPEI
jgi:hypothetical protein